MPTRPKHQKKELEAVLKAGEAQGWTVTRGKGYFKMKCPCEEKHLKTVRLSPSGANYKKNLISLLVRETCWEED
jgi:hypothetical protein